MNWLALFCDTINEERQEKERNGKSFPGIQVFMYFMQPLVKLTKCLCECFDLLLCIAKCNLNGYAMELHKIV